MRTFLKTSLLILSVVVFSGCAASTNPISGRRAYNYAWSPSEEIQIGTDADSQIVAQYGLYDDEEVSSYVEDLGQKLVEISHFRREGIAPVFGSLQFHFRVLDSPVVNAFALPGGFVYVTRGLLAHLENEAQLAVVLGHEIGHVVGRHGSKAMWRQQFGTGALLLGAIGSQAVFGGNAAENVLNLGGTATQLLFLKYGRGAESESDQLGVEYAALTGYDASQAAAFFRSLKRLGEQSGQELPGLLSSHPDPGDREAYMIERSAKWAAQVPMEKVGREPFLTQVDGIVYGENPRQGFVRDGVFYHPDLAFSFPVPSGFDVINQPTQVAMVPEDQQALVLFSIDTEHERAREAADALKAQEGIQVVESGIGQSGGTPMHYVVVDAKSAGDQELRIRYQYIEYGGNVFAFTGMALRSAYSTYSDRFVRTMTGFRPVTDDRILATQPDRVALLRTVQTATLGTLIGSNLPQNLTQLSMAILNQVEISQQIPAGTTVKTIR